MMIARTRALVLAASALTTLATLTACSGAKMPTAAASPTTEQVAPTPIQSTYLATLAGRGGTSMALSVSVAGDDVVAYANNGTDDEAWFFGTQTDGAIDLTSVWEDNLTATFDGTTLDGTVTMNDIAYTGSAASAAAPAGAYTATMGEGRSSWIVMPDRTAIGVMTPTSLPDSLAIERLNAEMEAVESAEAAERQRQMKRMMRRDRLMMAAPAMNTMTAAMPVTAPAKSLPTP